MCQLRQGAKAYAHGASAVRHGPRCGGHGNGQCTSGVCNEEQNRVEKRLLIWQIVNVTGDARFLLFIFLLTPLPY